MKILVRAKGGPTSGNYGHGGRKGQVGGSAPRGASNPEISKSRHLARRLRRDAERVEPEISANVKGAVESVGGRLDGFDFRLKSEASIRSKLFRDREESGGKKSLEQVASELTDLVRYTAVLDEKGFGDAVASVQSELQGRGWEQYDSKWRNYFVPGNVYQGYNTVMIDPKSGKRYELQFHTAESLRRKERGHAIYEEFRELKPDDPRRQILMNEQRSLWDGFNMPEGSDRLPGIVVGG